MTGSPSAQFFRRHREQVEIRTTVDEVAAGCGGLVLVSGEPGIRSTRLVRKVTAGLGGHRRPPGGVPAAHATVPLEAVAVLPHGVRQ